MSSEPKQEAVVLHLLIPGGTPTTYQALFVMEAQITHNERGQIVVIPPAAVPAFCIACARVPPGTSLGINVTFKDRVDQHRADLAKQGDSLLADLWSINLLDDEDV